MKCEIEFIAVGDASCAGDAIIVRYGEPNSYQLMLVDGGHAATGEQIVAHLRQHFGENVFLNQVVLTHPDADHASGLRTVLAEMHVEQLWMHVPWLNADPALFAGNWTANGLERAIKKEYDILSEIWDIATDKGVPIYLPFAEQKIGAFIVCSPSEWAYRHLVPQFDKTPDSNQEAIEAAQMWIGKETIAKKLLEKARAAVTDWIGETWTNERLKDGGITSASNETSVILYGQFEDGNVLLTGDGGLNALEWSANQLDFWGLPLQQFKLIQVPHHGSRRNIGPSILNRILGPIVAEGSDPTSVAYVSAPADDAKHPRRIVTNAFMRRGARVIATQGTNKIHYGGFPTRDGYVSATPLTFQTVVENYD
jgi:beta-lactamase superfamily II metal-dependent hydrolase